MNINLIFLTVGIIYLLIIGLVIDIVVVAPIMSKYNETANKKIPPYLIIIILIITPFMYPILYIIFYGVKLCWEFKEWLHNYNIKKRFHDYFHLN